VFVGQNTTTQATRERLAHDSRTRAYRVPKWARGHHRIEEGIATYVEPIARAQIGDLTPKTAWAGMFEGMPEGGLSPQIKDLIIHTPGDVLIEVERCSV
jgi:hypothetical protein